MKASDPYQSAVSAYEAGNLATARNFANQAIQSMPGAPQPHTLAGVIALNQNQPRAAIELFRKAIRLAHTPVEAVPNWVGWGRALSLQGDIHQALECFVKAGKLVPDFVPALSGEAAARMELGDYTQAEKVARRSLGLREDSRTRLILARCLLFQGRIGAAKLLFDGLVKYPETAFNARFHLAGILRAEGDVAGAEAAFRCLIEVNSDYPSYYELAKSKTFTHEADPDLKCMQDMLTRLTARVGESKNFLFQVLQSDVLFALGKAYDDLSKPDQAFPCFHRGNAIRAEMEPYAVEQFATRLEKVLGLPCPLDGSLSREVEKESPGCTPLWIAALPRSGSTLLEQMLCGHPAIAAGGEFSPVIALADRLLDEALSPAGSPPKPEALLREFRRGAQGRLAAAVPARGDCLYLTEKSPVAFLYMGWVAAVFPAARILHLRRHPLDMALSQYMQLFSRGLGWTYDLPSIAAYQLLYEKAMHHWRSVLGERLHEVYYEALVQRPEPEIRAVLAFLGLDYDPSCRHYESRRRAVWTASNAQVREPLFRRGIGRWKSYRKHLGSLIASMEPSISSYEAKLKELGIR